jgi:hypothetical protein
MDPLGAWTTLLASAALLLWTVLVVRPGSSQRAVDVLLGLGAAGVAIGGLLLQQDVGLFSWLITPVLLAALAIAHVRVLFAGTGPMRT